MDIIFVRTKLQALVVLNLISKNLISKNFIFVKAHQKDINEDAIELDFFYKKIEEKAFYTTHLVEKNGLIRCSLQVCLLSILAVISCGACSRRIYLILIEMFRVFPSIDGPTVIPMAIQMAKFGNIDKIIIGVSK